MPDAVAPNRWDDGSRTYRIGELAIRAAFALGLICAGLTTVVDPTLLPVLAAGLVSLPALVYVVRRPTLNLFVVLVGLVLTVGYNEGIKAEEVLHGMYLLLYLFAWFAIRMTTPGALRLSNAELALLVFLALVPLTGVLTALWGGDFRQFVSQTFAMMHLALYFPMRDAIRSSENGGMVVLSAFLIVGTFVAIRNLINYQEIIARATLVWQLERGRVVANDALLMGLSLTYITMVVSGNTRLRRVAFLGLPIALAALILTQSRTYWVALVIGIVVLLLIVDRGERRRLLFVGTTLTLALGAIGIALFSSQLALIGEALVTRLTTIPSALSNDISLLNRYLETFEVMRRIAVNPIVGYGPGVSFAYFDITHHSTNVGDFIHNGYLSLWYRFGIWGLAMVMYFWMSTVMLGIRALRRGHGESGSRRTMLVAGTVVLITYLLPIVTSNPFALNDTIFLIALMTAFVSGNGSPTSRRT